MQKNIAVASIQVEREQQKTREGYDDGHDDAHTDGSILRAAVIYYLHATGKELSCINGVPMGWPWEAQWWKPKDKKRDLVRAGALCMAERDRIVRDLKARRSGPVQRRSRRYWPPHVRQKFDLIVKALEAV